ncbi:MAG: hypothetical protein AB1942_12800 [Pseudomonadota bacterium]
MPSERVSSDWGGAVLGVLKVLLGVVAGFVTIPALWLAFMLASGSLSSALWSDNSNLPMVSSGEAISKAGGREVKWTAPDQEVRQSCRGACDDLEFGDATPRRVEVRAEGGRCLVCDAPSLVARLSPWINGPPAVAVQLKSQGMGRP